MAQKNPQLCWIQKHAEEICNASFGPHKKFNFLKHPSFNIIHGKLKMFANNALPEIDLEMEM
ncbi:hypothetical protein T05_7222 [Trichinella murrelli]|uniref:Uncharacterized protein n=1 Tax=Trichinella murrelli TaxID=144512 RepID=A0A0V0TRX2_9BILA|nr:hypothetical protein T05_7222 [Trichinella murrelli]